MPPSGKRLYFSRFMPSLESGGGSRRQLQVQERIRQWNFELVSSARSDWLDQEARDRINAGVALNLRRRSRIKTRPRMWSEPFIPMVYRLRAISMEWIRCLSIRTPPEIVLIDDPVYFAPLMEYFHHRGIPVVAVCHNLEGLGVDRMNRGSSLKMFFQEKSMLARCRLVVTISRGENVLLANLGIPVVHLPYYPVEGIRNRLLAVRDKRIRTEKRDFILLGNVFNTPTREGMVRVIDYWRSRNLRKTGDVLQVAGFHSQEFFDAGVFEGGVEMLGTLSDAGLDDHLARVKGCLCYQENGAGALTRICEFLLAGIPVLANSHAARSYHGRKGLIEFQSLEELESLIGFFDRTTAVIPDFPQVEIAPFTAAMERLLSTL